MIGLVSSRPQLSSLQTGDIFLFERNSGNYYTYFSSISGQAGGGGTTIITGNSVRFAVGTYNFLSGQNDSTFISFGGNFLLSPNIIGNLSNNSGEPILAFQLSGVTPSGFYVNLTDTVTGNYYNFNYMATTGTGFLELGGGFLNTDATTYTVANKTGNYSIQSNENKTIFSNQFSRKQGLQLSLPSAATGLSYQFIVHSISGISIIPTSTNRIFVADNITSMGGFIYSSGIGSSINLVAIDTGTWITTSSVGGWSLI